jgi:hypothetical protein
MILYTEINLQQGTRPVPEGSSGLLEEQYMATDVSSRMRRARARERTIVVTVIGDERQSIWN